MIEILEKKDCCGCEACVQRCPKQCITLKEDEEGFLYPEVNKDVCIACGLCEKVCPVINQGKPIEPLSVFAAINPDEEVRLKSSSGGIFTMLAESVIDRGGVVFGVSFNKEWEVVHKYTETKEGLAEFRGSKYVQSRVDNTFSQAETFLKQGREVLFSGTPCQIAGLKRFLRKDYSNLLTVDFICHGVPSPGVFRQYLGEEKEKVARKGRKNTVSFSSKSTLVPERDMLKPNEVEIEHISFRDKTAGWKKYSFVLVLTKATAAGEKIQFCSRKNLRINPFLRGFLKDLYLRPSCHECPAKLLKSGSDITIADFWGITALMPAADDDKGYSIITLNSTKGEETIGTLSIRKVFFTYEDLKRTNRAIECSPTIPLSRVAFFSSDGKTFHEKIKKLAPIEFKKIIKLELHKLINLIRL